MNFPATPPWHEGERELQSRAGVAERMAQLGPRLILDRIPDQHRSFFEQLPFLLAGSTDAAGQPWASVLAAPRRFVHSPDDRHLRVEARPCVDDPLHAALAPGAQIGLLGIEPHTRRRNRANGVVGEVDAQGFSVEVRQSFGNCPKYIQAREPRHVAGSSAAAPTWRGHAMNDAARRLVGAADTFFIASAHAAPDASTPDRGIDVSHRGGRPGFVRITGGDTLTVPDFAGNAFFNTLGNIAIHPRAGLLFIDFDTGDVVQLAVKAAIDWDGPEVSAFAGAQRLLRMKVIEVRYAPAALPLRWSMAELSPFLDATGPPATRREVPAPFGAAQNLPSRGY